MTAPTKRTRSEIARQAALARWNYHRKQPPGRDLTGFIDLGSGFLVPPEFPEAERWKAAQRRTHEER